MKKRSILCGIVLWMFILTACTGNAPASTPTVDPNAIATAVATMLSGISTATSLPEPTATLMPEPPTLLPRSLYYLAQDANGMGQIYRLGRDGATITQITFEQEGVVNFEISPADGTIAYITQNSLITVNPRGENRQTLTQDPNIGFQFAWSPDGKMIAYGMKQVTLYNIVTGTNEVLPSDNDVDYFPLSFSPDGRKLLVRKRVIPSAPEARPILIYDFDSQTLTSLAGGKPNCFDGVSWNTRDEFFCYKHVFAGGSSLGLFRVNAVDGSVESLVFSDSCSPCMPVAALHLNVDGNLYYLYAEVYGVNPTYPSLSLVRSKQDGITDRIALRPETFNVFNALWAPDGSSLLIVQNDGIKSIPTNLILVPIDPSLPIVTIMADAPYSLRWGP